MARGEFEIGIPFSFRPAFKAFMIRLEKVTGKKLSMHDAFCLILAKGIGAPYLYEDMIREREANRALRKDKTLAKRQREKAKKQAQIAKRKEAKEKLDAKKRMLEGEATLDELLTKAGMDIERYEKGVLPIAEPMKPKRKRRTKAEMEQARKQKARAKAMKAQPETFFMDVPK